jgi:TolB-like protein/Tfp pilus assembly protein PilF
MGGVELLMLTGILVVAGVAMALMGRGEDAQAEARLGGAAPEITLPRAERNSVAVLPFANLSRDPENEYFSDGITDEILTTLANVGDLRVISRTSVMQYKGTAKPLRQIASELGVAHVLEGSVQRAGERVRINAQLIDASTDAQLWAERYDRPLQDIFALQSEIAQQIAQALRVRISPNERARLERPRTANFTAYDYVLRGRELVRRPTQRDNEAGLSLLRRTRELDPRYADAYTTLAEAFLNQYFFHGDRMWLDSVSVAAQRAIALDPEFAHGYHWLGFAYDWRGERDAALEAHRRAVELNPYVSGGLANVYHYSFGRLDEAAHWWRPVLEGDPTNSVFYWLAGRTYLNLGMTAHARALLEKSVEFQLDLAWSYYNLSTTFLLEGRPDEARAQIQRMLTASGNAPDALLFAGHHALALGDFRAARGYLERAPIAGGAQREAALGTLTLAWILQRSGEADRARTLVREAAGQLEQWWGSPPTRPEGLVDLARVRVLEGNREDALRQMEAAVRHGWRLIYEWPMDPILDSLRGDPRFDRLMAEVMADVARQRARVEREGW